MLRDTLEKRHKLQLLLNYFSRIYTSDTISMDCMVTLISQVVITQMQSSQISLHLVMKVTSPPEILFSLQAPDNPSSAACEAHI
jgi:hypothetical protein